MSEMFQKLITNAWTFYDNEIDRIARRAFDEVVKPFCVKRKIRFLPGNGEWAMIGPDGGHIYDHDLEEDEDDEAQEVLAVLELDLDGFNQTLGTLMPAILKVVDREGE